MRSFQIAVLLWIAVVGSTVAVADTSSGRLSRERCLRLLEGILDDGGRAPPLDSYLETYFRLKQNREFAQFLAKVQPPPNPQDGMEARKIILDYFIHYTRHFASSAAIEVRRAQILAASLIYRGHALGAGDPREQLATISRTNLAREQKLFPYRSTPAMADVERFFDATPLVHVHNSNTLEFRTNVPLISFDLLAAGGFPTENFASNTWFNRYFLRTTDDVFFHVYFGVRKGQSAEHKRVTDLILQPEFANHFGVVSPFIMYVSQLKAFAKVHAPAEYEIIKEDTETNMLGFKSHLDAWNRVRLQLRSFDFTREDFQAFIRQVFLARMAALAPEDLKRVQGQLHGPNAAQDFAPVLKKYVLEPLGFEAGFELRVPMAVPNEALDFKVSPRTANVSSNTALSAEKLSCY